MHEFSRRSYILIICNGIIWHTLCMSNIICKGTNNDLILPTINLLIPMRYVSYFKKQFSNWPGRSISRVYPGNDSHVNATEPTDDSQNWFNQWLGAIRQQVIIWANSDLIDTLQITLVYQKLADIWSHWQVIEHQHDSTDCNTWNLTPSRKHLLT